MTLPRPDRIMGGGHPGEVLLQYEARDGRPRRVDAYHATRAGVSWPGADCPGYYCILGLKNEPSISQSPPHRASG
jgi:hypothetical protein